MKLFIAASILLSTNLAQANSDLEYEYVRGEDSYIYLLDEDSPRPNHEKTESGLYCKVVDSDNILYFQVVGPYKNKGFSTHVYHENGSGMYNLYGRNIKAYQGNNLGTEEYTKLPITYQFIPAFNDVKGLIEVFALDKLTYQNDLNIEMIEILINKNLKGSISVNALENVKQIDCNQGPNGTQI